MQPVRAREREREPSQFSGLVSQPWAVEETWARLGSGTPGLPTSTSGAEEFARSANLT